MLPSAGIGAPSTISNGRCSSLGLSACNPGWPSTTVLGTPLSTATLLWPASQVAIPALGWLITLLITSTAGWRSYSLGNWSRLAASLYTTVPGDTWCLKDPFHNAEYESEQGSAGFPEVIISPT